MPNNEQTELQYLIALTMAPAVGPTTARLLIDTVGSARAVLHMRKKELEKIKGIGPKLAESFSTRSSLLEQAEKEMKFLERYGIRALYYKDMGYPQQLNNCSDGPILLYTKGDQDLNPAKILSVVGTRRASPYGRDLCREIVRELAEMIPGLVIVSGLAYGIDVIGHKAALEYGLPTVAVLGHGLHTMYPNSHRGTAKRIVEQGALITDFHSGMGPERNNFLRRNRIIAGMSPATLVVESAEKGGALVTADIAFSYDRTVLAAPGRTFDQRSKGCNKLIKMNMAALTESALDVINYLNWDIKDNPQPTLFPEPQFLPLEKKILNNIQNAPGITPEALCNLTGIQVQTVLAVLMEMELKGWITSEPGNRYSTFIAVT
jgi:DNA processing protein